MQQGERRLCRVLLIYRQMVPSIRLCGHCQMQYLAQKEKIEYRAVQEMKLRQSDLDWADVVLLGRLDSWYEYRLTQKLREAGEYLVYIIDDDLLNIPGEISSAAYFGKEEIQGYIRAMIEMSDAIVSPSPLLLEKYAVNGRKAIRIEEPAINPVPYRPHDPNGPVKIGFAGSNDRKDDIEGMLRDVLLDIRQAYGDRVQFEFFGVNPSFAGELGARCIPYCRSYEEYRQTLNSLQWDIGLAPMPDTPFHACKHYNKFMEYAAAGVVGVFSEIMPYTQLHAFEPAAVLCANHPEHWKAAIRDLIDSPEKREKLREACVQIAAHELSIPVLSEALLDSGSGLLDVRKARSSRVTGLTLLKARGMYKRVLEKAARMLNR